MLLYYSLRPLQSPDKSTSYDLSVSYVALLKQVQLKLLIVLRPHLSRDWSVVQGSISSRWRWFLVLTATAQQRTKSRIPGITPGQNDHTHFKPDAWPHEPRKQVNSGNAPVATDPALLALRLRS